MLKGASLMQQEELQFFKETGQKGDFLLPFTVCRTIMPDFYTTYPMHWHDEMELVYVEKGEYDVFIDLEGYHVKKGDIVIVNPYLLHSFRQYNDERTVFRTIIFNINMLTGNNTDACAIKYLTPYLEGFYINPIVISPDSSHYDELKECVLKLIAEFDNKEKFYEIKIKAELFNMFHILFNHFFMPDVHEPSIKDNTTRNIKTILDYIEANYMKTITIDELAESVNLSKHYFMRFFKKYMGMTCIEYINDYRLNVATNLLLTTGMQITEVAAQIGITNLSYFNRIFKKKYNMTPKEYRYNVDNRK